MPISKAERKRQKKQQLRAQPPQPSPHGPEQPQPPAGTCDDACYRCWICLGDESSLDTMVAPCDCTGTTEYVHVECINAYCLEALVKDPPAAGEELTLPCPICRAPYSIIPAKAAAPRPWRELLRRESTDGQLLLRFLQFALLAAPLAFCVCHSWARLLSFWRAAAADGPGPPLLADARNALMQPNDLLRWARPPDLPLLQRLLDWVAEWKGRDSSPAVDAEAAEAAEVAAEAAEVAAAARPHPSGVSVRWSACYVSLQYYQWYKILSWLLCIGLGGNDALLPERLRGALRIDELVLASEWRFQLVWNGQVAPFAAATLRHFVISWAGSAWMVQQLFYGAFTSYVEVALVVACDTLVAAVLCLDWLGNVRDDFTLCLNLNRLRLGLLVVAPQAPRRKAKSS